MRQEADRITGAQHRDHEHHEHHHHQPASSFSSSSNAAGSPLFSKTQEASSTHPHFLTTSLPSPSSSIVPASPAPGPDAEELLSALQVTPHLHNRTLLFTPASRAAGVISSAFFCESIRTIRYSASFLTCCHALGFCQYRFGIDGEIR